MPSLFDTFRFTANDGVGDTQVYPLNSGLRRRWEREGDTRSYRVKLTTKLLFKGDDYTYFRDLYDAGDCTEISLLIENYCGGDWVTWFEGIVPIYNGDYNADRCEVTFEVKPNDVYECAKKAFEVRENWLSLTPGNVIKTFYGTVETITCTQNATRANHSYVVEFTKNCWGSGFTSSEDPDAALAWRPIRHLQDYEFILSSWYIGAETTWAREKATSVLSPPGDGWINISGTTWVRPVNVSAPVIVKGTANYELTWTSDIINMAPISNGHHLGDTLEIVAADMDCDIDIIISNFFNINPDATNPSNDAYDYAAANFESVFFFQKSDIVRASASNDATRFTFSLKEFFNEIKIFNLFYAITVEAGVKKLRIEHYTYFDGVNGLDLTTLDGGIYITGRDSFKTDREVPNFESFAYQESYRPKFLVKRITYPPACATTQGDERTAQQICTDFGGLVENPDAGLEGFFLMATHEYTGSNFIMNTLGGDANGAFAWENLLPAIWADGRFHMDATANIPVYAVTSLAKSREQDAITIKFCCDDAFEASELVQTQLGWGEVKTAEEDTERATLKLNLLQ